MPVEVVMPKLGLTMRKGRVVEWRKREGDPVKEGEVIAVIETEKLTHELKAPASGVLLKILVPPKTEVPVGQVIAYIGSPGEPVPEVVAPERPVPVERPSVVAEAIVRERPQAPVRATPRARRLAEERGIDLTKITGTGPGGLITEEDVLREIERREKYTSTGLRVRESIPLTPMRETIARRMTESLHTMAQVTLGHEAVVDALVKLREEIVEEYFKKTGVRVTYTDMLIKIVAMLLRDHPYLNATLEGDRIKLIEEINIGVGVAIDHGLIVPVIRGADKKSLEEIAREAHDLAERARKGLLTPDEVTGSTFTITNLGMFGIDYFTPIINPPESAILGIGRITRKPVVVGDEIKIAHTMWLSLTFDHRVMDGHVAARFLQDLAGALNDRDRLRRILGLS